jgi:hypothetical protein
MRLPSPKKKREYSIGLHSEKVGSVVVNVNGIPNNHTGITAQTLASCEEIPATLKAEVNRVGREIRFERLGSMLYCVPTSRRSHGRVST